MEYGHRQIVAKQIASILAENEAAVSDLPLIFEAVRERLTVAFRDMSQQGAFVPGRIIVPSERTDDGETYDPLTKRLDE